MSNDHQVIKYGMIGGGEGSFIGAVHRKAIGMTDLARISCGCFDIDQDNNIKSGLKYGIESGRIYKDYLEMAEMETLRSDKIDFVVITTPNNLHYPIAREFLTKGFNVICEKPLCLEVAEGLELKQLAENKGLQFGITYTYIGYPMVKQARQMIKDGVIGEIVEVIAEYAQDWVGELCATTDGKINIWRNDPLIVGKSSCVGDIGSHIECTVAYLTGLSIKSVCANLRVVGKGLKLDSTGEILVKYDNGASGVYWCSQVAYGYNNGLRIRVFGTKGSLEWEQEDPCILKIALSGEPARMLIQGKEYLYGSTRQYCNLPAGHPEGFYEAFSNIYRAFIKRILTDKKEEKAWHTDLEFAGIDDGIRGVKFIDGCVNSSQNHSVWINIE